MRVKSLSFHVLMLATIAGVAALGIWQLHRREWKHHLIHAYKAVQSAAPQQVKGAITEKQLWQKLKVFGTVNYSQAILLPVYVPPENKLCGLTGWGFRVLAPLRLSNGQILPYQNGFIPETMKNNLPQQAQSGELTVSVWPLRAPSWLPPHNDPVQKKWLVLDPSLYEAWHRPRQKIYLNSEFGGTMSGDLNDGEACDYPVNYWRQPVFVDNHLQYAITWFALAALLIGYYVYYQWSRRNPKP